MNLLLKYLHCAIFFCFTFLCFAAQADAALLVSYDAADIDGVPPSQNGDICSTTDTNWVDTASVNNGTLNNFTLPCSTDSGWDGDGTDVSDPYILRFDGIDDYVAVSTNISPRTYEGWFRVDQTTAGNRYIFSANSTVSYAYVNSNVLYMRYNNGIVQTVPIEPDTWYYIVMSNDGITTTFYINGVEVAADVRPQQATYVHNIGRRTAGADYFDGAIGLFQMYSDGLTPVEVANNFAANRDRYLVDLGNDPVIERVSPAIVSTAGGETIEILGVNFTNVNQVRIDGSNVSYTIISDTKIEAITAAHAEGDVSVSVRVPGTTTSEDALRYSDASVSNLTHYMDPSNIDGAGAKGDGSTNTIWNSLDGGTWGTVQQMSHPTDGTSGWDGDGTAITDPYIVRFDGTNDFVQFGNVQGSTYAGWIKADAMSADYPLSVGGCYACVYLNANTLYMRYNNGSWQTTPISTDTWYHFAMTNDGSISRFYLNGQEYSTESRAGPHIVRTMNLGRYISGTNYYDGSLGPMRVYSTGLSASEIGDIYAEERGRFFETAGPEPQFERITPALLPTIGGSMEITGYNLSGVTDVEIDGVSVSFTVNSDVSISVVAPAHATGRVSVSMTNVSGTTTISSALHYFDTLTSNIVLGLDPQNNNTLGSNGVLSESPVWSSVVNDTDGAVLNIDAPSSADSGWRGDGTAITDQYRLQFDGTDDYVSYGSLAGQTYMGWFYADAMSNRYFFSNGGCLACGYLSTNGSMYLRYNNGNWQITPINIGEWNHFAMINDGTTTRFYLNGSEYSTENRTAHAASNFYLGNYNGSSNYFDGALGIFRVYSDAISVSNLLDTYNAERPLYRSVPSVGNDPYIERITDSLQPTTGGSVTITGLNFTGTTDVQIDGTSVAFTVMGDSIIDATVLAHAAGVVDISITNGAGTTTYSDAIMYSDTLTIDSVFYLDPQNTNTKGDAGSLSTSDTWSSLVSSIEGTLTNITLPSDADSGWNGDGTPVTSPYTLHFDGVDDYVPFGSLAAQTYMGWIKADSMNNRYFFSNGGCRVCGYVNSNDSVQFRYNNGGWHYAPMKPDEWNHFAIINDGSTTTFYLNGNAFASESRAAHAASNFFLGNYNGTSSYFDGELGVFRAYSSALTEDTMRDIYNEERSNYLTSPSVGTAPYIERITPAVVSTAGGSIQLKGYNFTGVTDVQIDGISAGYTLSGDSILTVTAPSHAAGNVSVSVTTALGTDTAVDALRFTDTLTSNSLLHLDPQNIDTIGSKGSASTSTRWSSLTNNRDGLVMSMTLPADSDSGWDGDGTAVTNPYLAHFDGSNDNIIFPSIQGSTYMGWFKAEALSADYIFSIQGCYACAYLNANTLYLRYNNGSWQTVSIATDEWYHFAITNDGSTSKFYLNGTEYSSESRTGPHAIQTLRLGAYYNESAFYNGSIGPFRVYSDDLSSVEIGEIYAEEYARYFVTTGPEPDIQRLTPSLVSTAGGTIDINGINFNGTTDVQIDGTSVSYTLNSAVSISVTAPAKTEGSYDLTVTNGAGSTTKTDAVTYKDILMNNLLLYVDPANNNTLGYAGTLSTSSTWSSLISSTDGSMTNFTLPADGDSGWAGAGVSGTDPYTLHFDGSNDQVSFGSLVGKTYTGWFKTDALSPTQYPMSNAGCRACVYLNAGYLYMRYNWGAVQYNSIQADTWYHYAIVNDGSVTTFYLNGIPFATDTRTTHAAGNFHLGAYNGTSNFFNGHLGIQRVYSEDLTQEQIFALYGMERPMYRNISSSQQINRLSPALVDPTGGESVYILGNGFDATTAVTVDGVDISGAFSELDDNALSLVSPAHADAIIDLSIDATAGTIVATDALRYSTTVLADMLYSFDAENIDSAGTAGDGSTNQDWIPTRGGQNMRLYNMAQPTDSTSGWDGAGTQTNLYRLQFDGSNDYAQGAPVAAQGYAVWFTPDVVSGGTKYLFYKAGASYAYINGGSLYMRYNNSTVLNTPINAGSGYTLVMTSDGTTASFYLNNTLVGTAARAAETLVSFMYLGSANGTSGFYDGCIGQFRAYSQYLDSSEVAILSNQQLPICGSDPVADVAAPVLESFSTTVSDGVYTPGAAIDIYANYDEPLSSGEMTIRLSNGVSVILSEVVGNSIKGTYVVGSVFSEQSIPILDIGEILSHSTSDQAVPSNTNTSTSLPATNISGSKNILIDSNVP